MKTFFKFLLLIGLLIGSLTYAMYLDSDEHRAIKAVAAEKAAEEQRIQDLQVELKVFHYVDSSKEAKNEWEFIKKNFEDKYPHITLNAETAYDSRYDDKLQNYADYGNLPDVMYLWSGGRHNYLFKNGNLEDLSKFLDLTEWHSIARRPQGLNGEVFVLPFFIGTATSILFTNDALLEELGLEKPETYADLKAMVKPLRKAGKEVLLMSNAAEWVMSACLFSTILARTAGPDWINEVVQGRAKFTDDEFINALRVVADLYKNGILAASSLDLTYGDGPGEFAAGKAPFLIDGQWRFETIEYVMDMEQISFRAFPALENEAFPATVSMVQGAGMGMRTGLSEKKKAAAIEFIRFMAGMEAAEKRMENEHNNLPSIKDFDLSDYKDLPANTIKMHEYFSEYTGASMIDIILPSYINDYLNNGLQELSRGYITPRELATELQNLLEDS